MSKVERREQLLATAYEIIRRDGTNALTLVSLAEQAGVSRPVAYEHFESRDGLLMALYRDYDEQLGRIMRGALEAGGASLEDVAQIMSSAYVDGVLRAGPECEEVRAALAGDERTKNFQQLSRDFHVEQLRQAIEPFVGLPELPSEALLQGILAATDELAYAAAEGRITRAAAIAAVTTITVGSVGLLATTG
jgi:AcrR family transcriptional regulator